MKTIRSLHFRSHRGFTLTELLLVLGIISLLTGIGVGSYSGLRRKAEALKCTSHMKRIHVALELATQDIGHWPQGPDTPEENTLHEFWHTTLKPYDIDEQHWYCPTDKRLLSKVEPTHRDDYESSYVITTFDDNPLSPYIYSTPWLFERGNFHLKGALIVMPNGGVEHSYKQE